MNFNYIFVHTDYFQEMNVVCKNTIVLETNDKSQMKNISLKDQLEYTCSKTFQLFIQIFETKFTLLFLKIEIFIIYLILRLYLFSFHNEFFLILHNSCYFF